MFGESKLNLVLVVGAVLVILIGWQFLMPIFFPAPPPAPRREVTAERQTAVRVAIRKRVDCLELVVLHGHSDKRINICAFMHEGLPVIQFLDQQLLADRRRVDELSACPVVETCSRIISNIKI